MGRTAPAGRVAVERELERLLRAAGSLRDPGDRALLECLLRGAYRVLDAFRYTPMMDPLEPVVLGALLALARGECREGRDT